VVEREEAAMAVRYIAYNREGTRVTGVLDVDTPQEATQILDRAEMMVVKVERASRFPPLHKIFPTLFPVKTQDLVSTNRELATLMESGVPLARALRVLLDQEMNPFLKEAIRDVLREVEEGVAFSETLAHYPKVFPALYSRLVNIGEQTGKLVPMLHQVADYLERSAEVASKLRSALTYPLVVVGVAVASIYVLLTVSLPALAGLFEEFGAELPLLSRIVIGVGKYSGQYGGISLIVLILLGFLGWRFLQTAEGSRRKDYFFLRMPLLGGLSKKAQAAWFTGTLTTLLNAGVQLMEAMQLMVANADYAPMKDALIAIREDLLTGGVLSEAMAKHEVFPKLVVQTVAVAEEGGTLTQQLTVLTGLYQNETTAAIQGMTSLIEPIVIVAVGAIVGVIAATVINTVYSLLPAIR